jgi:hypothetical protein
MGNRRHDRRGSAPQHRPAGTTPQGPSDGDTFDARDYVLTTPPDHEPDQTKEDFDVREWFLLDAVEPETEARRLRRLLSEAGFPELHLEAAADDEAFHFRYRIVEPETYSTEAVHDQLVNALGQIGYTVVIAQIAVRLDAGMTSGTFWLATRG